MTTAARKRLMRDFKRKTYAMCMFGICRTISSASLLRAQPTPGAVPTNGPSIVISTTFHHRIFSYDLIL